jgi:hypothetical protein
VPVTAPAPITVRAEPQDPFPRADRLTAAAVGLLLAASVVVGVALNLTGRPVRASSPPIYGFWGPHLGPGTPAALAIAAAVIWYGQLLAARLTWRRLLLAGYLAAVGWTLALALVDGWRSGIANRLTEQAEYLRDVPGVTDIGAMVRGFSGRILDFQPDSWTTHVSGHPPGALLTFVWLDRIGLGGGGAAAIVCILAGGLIPVAVPVTLRALHTEALDTEAAARAAVPFLVLLPGAVWVGVSADGLFAGLTSTGIALLALAVRRRGPLSALFAVAAGAVLAFCCYLSYGLILMAPLALTVLTVKAKGRAPSYRFTYGKGPLQTIGGMLVGGALVVGGFTAAGFWWLDGYHLVVQRYYQGVAAERPYAYWVWANLACLLLAAGPAAAVIIRRAVHVVFLRRPPNGVWFTAPVLLPLAAGLSMLAADLSGLSKAEVERIWLPFAVWLLAGAGLLPARSRQGWLIAQAVTALLVNHLVRTVW